MWCGKSDITVISLFRCDIREPILCTLVVEKDVILCDINVISHIHTESNIKVISHVVPHYMVKWFHSDITLCLKWYHLWYQSDITLGSVQCQKCYHNDFTVESLCGKPKVVSLWEHFEGESESTCDIKVISLLTLVPKSDSTVISLSGSQMWFHCRISFRSPKVISLWYHS